MSKHQHLTRAAEEPVKPPSNHKVDPKQSRIGAERRPYSHPKIKNCNTKQDLFREKKIAVDKGL
jgi:hypothetical protein